MSNPASQVNQTSRPWRRKPRKKHRPFWTVVSLLVMFGMIIVTMLGIYNWSLTLDVPEITEADLVTAQISFVYSADGQQIAELDGGEKRVSVPLSAMPQHLIDAVVAEEDIRFFEHDGVDLRGTIRAIVANGIESLRSGEVTFSQGASTITMQLVRNVLDEREKTLPRKIKEAVLATNFEQTHSKEEILYYYLNEIYLGPRIYGVEAASEYYFGKPVQDISIEEAAVLAGIIKNPGYYSPYYYPDRALNMRNNVLRSMAVYDPQRYGVSAIQAENRPLIVYDSSHDTAVYDHPWFVDYVVEEAIDIVEDMGLDAAYVYTGGLHIYSTLELPVQEAMETVFADDSNFPASRSGDIVESAMAIVEPTTGEIKGLMGGRVYTARRGFNRACDLLRSPGSSIKPLVTYGPAINEGFGAATIINDSPIKYGSWMPKNDDGAFRGNVTLREAVAGSRNICAVQMLKTIGPELGVEYGQKNGLPLVDTDATLAMTLGGLTYGVAPLDMAAAFATFANKGVYIAPHSIRRIETANGEVLYEAAPETHEVFTEQTAYIMTDVLTSVTTYGTGTAARLSGWQTAGKTGTNGLPTALDDPDYAGKRGVKDAWFCGYTTALSGAVWMGYDKKRDADDKLQYMTVAGGTYPARLWKKIMTLALENYEETAHQFTKPDGIVYCGVSRYTGGPGSDVYDMYQADNIRLEQVGDPVSFQKLEICTESGGVSSGQCPSTRTAYYLSDDPVPGPCTIHGSAPVDPGPTPPPDDPGQTETPEPEDNWVWDEED